METRFTPDWSRDSRTSTAGNKRSYPFRDDENDEPEGRHQSFRPGIWNSDSGHRETQERPSTEHFFPMDDVQYPVGAESAIGLMAFPAINPGSSVYFTPHFTDTGLEAQHETQINGYYHPENFQRDAPEAVDNFGQQDIRYFSCSNLDEYGVTQPTQMKETESMSLPHSVFPPQSESDLVLPPPNQPFPRDVSDAVSSTLVPNESSDDTSGGVFASKVGRPMDTPRAIVSGKEENGTEITITKEEEKSQTQRQRASDCVTEPEAGVAYDTCFGVVSFEMNPWARIWTQLKFW